MSRHKNTQTTSQKRRPVRAALALRADPRTWIRTRHPAAARTRDAAHAGRRSAVSRGPHGGGGRREPAQRPSLSLAPHRAHSARRRRAPIGAADNSLSFAAAFSWTVGRLGPATGCLVALREPSIDGAPPPPFFMGSCSSSPLPPPPPPPLDRGGAWGGTVPSCSAATYPVYSRESRPWWSDLRFLGPRSDPGTAPIAERIYRAPPARPEASLSALSRAERASQVATRKHHYCGAHRDLSGAIRPAGRAAH